MVQRGVQAIARNAQAQAVLVDDLLEMSRIVSGKQLMNVERVDVNAIATGAADTARPTAQARRLTQVVMTGSVVQADGQKRSNS